MIELKLPWPPSVNTYWRSPNKGPLAGRILISEKGRLYRTSVYAAILEQIGLKKIKGKLSVVIVAHPPDARRRDLDNLFKGVLDSITHAGVWADDSDIDELSIARSWQIKEGALIVRITTLSD